MIPATGAYSSRCRTCGREIDAEVPNCPHCGAANLEERCPHCGAVTTSSPDKEMRFHCDLCGGPRLPRSDPAFRRGKRELVHLKKANEARKSRAKSRALIAAFGAIGFVSTAFAGLLTLIFGLSLALGVVWGLFAGLSLLVIMRSLSSADSATKEMKVAVDQAWIAAASDVAARMKGAFTSTELGKALGVNETQAEELLAMLEVNDVVRSDVTSSGELAYQARIRIGNVDLDSPQAEAEALAEAEAMAAEERQKKART